MMHFTALLCYFLVVVYCLLASSAHMVVQNTVYRVEFKIGDQMSNGDSLRVTSAKY
jgi:hypothetical protein